MAQRLFSLSPPAYQLFNQVRQRVRPLSEPFRKKHLREERHSADYLLLSLTNCGRTWLRVILGRTMQLHYEIEKINLHDLFTSYVSVNLFRTGCCSKVSTSMPKCCLSRIRSV